MGREILYCTGCQTQLRESDFEKDRAFRIQNRAFCVDCAQGQIASLSPDQMKAMLRKIADPSTAPSTARAIPRPSSSSKTPRPPARRESGGPGLILGFVLGAAALLGLAWLLMSPGRPTPPPPVVDRPTPPPKPPPPRPPPVEAPNFPREIAALDDQARPLLARESFKAAADVYDAARGKYPDAQWKALLEGKAAEARKEAQRLLESLKAQAAEARKAGRPDQVNSLRTRVAAWGLSDLTSALETYLASVPEEKPWQPLFDGRTVDFLNPTDRREWHVQDGAITQKAEKTGAAQSAGTWGDGDYRFRFEVSKAASFMSFSVRQSATGSYSVGIDGAQIEALTPGPHEFIVVCRGTSVTATFDGRPMPIQTSGPSPAGHIQFNSSDGPMRVLAVDFRPTP